MFITNDAKEVLNTFLKERNKNTVVFEYQKDKNRVFMRFDNFFEKHDKYIYLNGADKITENWIIIKKDNNVEVIKRNVICKNGICKIK